MSSNKELNTQEYQEFRQFLEHQCGIVLGDNKLYLVKSRLSPLMSHFGIDSLAELVKRSMKISERALRSAVIDAMTTNETLWFRDTYPFEILVNRVFEEYKNETRPLKIWSSACSSGQEPYSIAMSYLEYKAKNPGALKGGIKITATDISNKVLEQCARAEYDSLAIVRGLSPERRKKFFDEGVKPGSSILKDEVKQFVQFRHLNLLDSYALLGKFDIIFCRNVLIYFSANIKRQIIAQFRQALNPKGYLFLGASESISGLTDDFEMIRCNPGIIYKRKN
ncbi:MULTISPECIES: protein-glutamate O-methyltransferase CheR [unclassified Idiomarina]|jgi:chemotaxis protein methyltransferase CheR|uniref:CheR family methyltransferase n=1 Tax=unclassified Idiomarina TaxID=2614829 RepID=UPI0008F89C8B|nr:MULTISPECIES: protein-glutamate O-methyltransferase CheR [unclassified Idiomarina]MEC7643391.1 protein-glutamate O-methyltransferase CheR [Pseudomonadota bacterium]NQZ04599.1 protein-glutamate O-methyltransferase CheR [Idiomarina sp.]OIM99518.1 chemotaxis protein CheR [Idiomarina sp. MD25a]